MSAAGGRRYSRVELAPSNLTQPILGACWVCKIMRRAAAEGVELCELDVDPRSACPAQGLGHLQEGLTEVTSPRGSREGVCGMRSLVQWRTARARAGRERQTPWKNPSQLKEGQGLASLVGQMPRDAEASMAVPGKRLGAASGGRHPNWVSPAQKAKLCKPEEKWY